MQLKTISKKINLCNKLNEEINLQLTQSFWPRAKKYENIESNWSSYESGNIWRKHGILMSLGLNQLPGQPSKSTQSPVSCS